MALVSPSLSVDTVTVILHGVSLYEYQLTKGLKTKMTTAPATSAIKTSNTKMKNYKKREVVRGARHFFSVF